MAKRQMKAYLCFDGHKAAIISKARPIGIMGGKDFYFLPGTLVNYVWDNEDGENVLSEFAEELKVKKITIIVED